jgi:predicted phage baseplate assembly protein
VQLLVVPDSNRQAIEQGVGIAPEQFRLHPPLHRKLMAYLDERRLLGVQVEFLEPNYVGLSVQTEVALDPAYRTPEAQTEVLHALNVTLYRFFNPLTGGPGGKGWPLGQPAYMSDAIALLQQVPGIRRLGAVQLFELRLSTAGQWIRSQPVPLVDPGPTGLICSWADPNLRSNHMINIID